MFRVVRDWEEQLSKFLQAVVHNPSREPQICEELIEYVLFLVQHERVSSRKAFEVALIKIREAV